MDSINDKSAQASSTVTQGNDSMGETSNDPSEDVKAENEVSLELQVLPSSFKSGKDETQVNRKTQLNDQTSHQEPSQSDTYSYSIFAFLWDLFSIASYLADVGSDIWIAVLYCEDGDWWWFSLTMAFVFLPCLIMGGKSVFQSCRDGDSCAQVFFTFVVTAVPGGPIVLYVWIITQELKVKNTRDKHKRQELYEETISCIVGLATLRLIEAFMEAAPQLVLQLHIICLGYGSTKPVMVAVQWASVGTSLGSLSWAVVSFCKSSRLESNKVKSSYFGLAIQFMWRVSVIGSRVLSLALFASTLPYGVFILDVIHLIVMDVWLVMQSTTYCLDSAEFSTFINFLPLAFVHIFCDIFIKEGRKRLRYCFYYTLMFLENVGMLLSWHFRTQEEELWFRYPAFGVVLGGFFIGTFFQIIYYLKCHPKNSAEDQKNNSIKLCIPYTELSYI